MELDYCKIGLDTQLFVKVRQLGDSEEPLRLWNEAVTLVTTS